MEHQQPDTRDAQSTSTPLTAAPSAVRTDKKRTLLGVWLVIGPTVLLVGTILLYAVANYIGGLVDPGPDQTTAMFGAPTLGGILVNTALFIVGVVGVLAWLPCLIIGIVILATKKRAV